jgi:uncharacterized protein (DUF433 family)
VVEWGQEADPVRWQERIDVDPNVCHGKPCIKGTRVLVTVVLDNLAAGESPEAIASAYRIEPADVKASLLYAADIGPV